MECITDTEFDFKNCTGSVLLKDELYLHYNAKDAFTKISNIDSLRKKTSLASPSARGLFSALTGYMGATGSFIFLTGGMKTTSLATVEVYSVDRDEWIQCPDLNNARNSHSSCILGDKLYVSGGCAGRLTIDSIEVASC